MAVTDGAPDVKLPRQFYGTLEVVDREAAHRQRQESAVVPMRVLEGSGAEKDGTAVNGGPVEKLVRIGFSEAEARAYLAVLQGSPMTSDLWAQAAGVPQLLGGRIAGQLVEHGAAVALPTAAALKYAPIPADELLDRLQREYVDLIAAAKKDLRSYGSPVSPNAVWTLDGEANILAQAETLIGQARRRIFVGALPATLECLRPALGLALDRGVQVVVYTTHHIELVGARVIVTPCPEPDLQEIGGDGLILVRDGQEALIGEWLATQRAQASWTRCPTLVSITEQHLVRGGRRRFPLLGRVDQPTESRDLSATGLGAGDAAQSRRA